MRQTKYTCDGCAEVVLHEVDAQPPQGWAILSIGVQGFVGWKLSSLRNIGAKREFCESCQLAFNHDILAALSADRGKPDAAR